MASHPELAAERMGSRPGLGRAPWAIAAPTPRPWPVGVSVVAPPEDRHPTITRTPYPADGPLP
jgi:hypothetical protein